MIGQAVRRSCYKFGLVEYAAFNELFESSLVARANCLNVITCGTTRYEAEQALLEAVELFLETAQQQGTLEDVMTESGYVLVEGKWVPFSKPERREMELRI